MLITYYTKLGIPENATTDEIKKAYRKKAFLHHPDRNNNSEESKQEFIKIQQAYNTLSDPLSRHYYDMALANYRKKETYKSKPKPQPQNINKNVNNQEEYSPKQASTFRIVCFPFIIFIALIILIYLNLEEESPKEYGETIKVDDYKNVIKRNSRFDLSVLEVDDNIDTKKTQKNNPKTQNSKDRKSISESPYYGKHLFTGNMPYRTYFGRGSYDKELPSYILIRNGSSSEAIVLLYDVNSSKVIRHIYIQAGHNYKMENIPVGIYKMKTYYGNDWNPNKRISNQFPLGGFMRDESFSTPASAKDFFHVKKEYDGNGYTYSVYEVTLYKVLNGNMRTKDISANNFFQN